MEKQKYNDCLHYDNKRNTEHEFDMLGFVADYLHCDEHCNASAESREEHEIFFGCAKLDAVFFRDFLVIDANYDGNE
jgi:hypothetical protein